MRNACGAGRLFAWVLAVVAFAACGGGRDVPDTRGGVCLDLGEAICDRAIACHLVENDFTTCVNQLQQACCGDDGTCGVRVSQGSVSDSEYDDCLTAYESFACADLEKGNTPLECLGL